MKAKQWMMEYGVAMMLAILLAVVLGHLPLFRDTAVGKLHASDVVQFIGYGTGIILAWFGARQLAADPPEEWQWLVAYRSLILPVTTLILVGLAYHVL
jgi:ABC-type dipeptide/oligopeptide/nickel transport system permease component